MKIRFTADIDLSIDDLITKKDKIQFIKEGEEALLIDMLLKSYRLVLSRCNQLRIKTIDVDSDDKVSERKRYRYSFSKFIDCFPHLKNDKTFEWDSIKYNSWYTRLDGCEVYPATDDEGTGCFALIDDGTIYSFNSKWCEETK